MLTETARQSLLNLLGKHQVTTHPVELMTYEVDAGLNQGSPDGVAFPQSVEDVARLVRWATEQRVPLVARSAGTGLSGGAVPSHGGVVVAFSRMNKILELDAADRVVVAQPGVINLALDSLTKSRGLYYPPDPASQRASTIGGNIAENAGGPHCFKYGVTTNYVMGLEVVLADGQVARTGGRAFDYPEYDFTGLLTGSEGTLALITQAMLRLMRNPPGVKTLTATFDSIETAGQAVSAIIAHGLVPAALEMMDRNIIGIIEDYVHAGLPTDAAALLLVEVDGYPESLDAQIAEVAEVLKQQQARTIRIYTPAEREQIWLARKSAFGAMARLSPAYFQVDGTVPRSKLSETLGGINQLCQRRGLRVGYVFHAGDGNLHPLIPFDPTNAEMTKRVYESGDEILKLCVSKDGSITGEHGVGIEKRRFMPLMYTPDELAAMREVKGVFDPLEVFNPGKIFPEEVAGSEQQAAGSEQQVADPATPSGAAGSIGVLSSPFIPQGEEEAAEGLRAAQASGRSVIIRGSSTQAAPPAFDAILLSTEKLQGVVRYAPEDLYVTVKAGTRLADLQATLAANRLWVPLATPWAESTIGGIISTGFNSPYRMRYGAVRDQVLGLRVVLPDGRRVRFGRPVVKNVAGYDMVKLFVGAYGTLGLITEATLRLTALPRTRRSLWVPVDSLAEGLKWAERVLPLALVASAIVLAKNSKFDTRGERSRTIQDSNYELRITNYGFLLVYTAEGYPQDVDAELRAVRATLSAAGANSVTESDARSGIDLWADLLRDAPAYLRIGVPSKTLPAFLAANASTLGEAYVADVASGLIYATRVDAAQVSSLRQAALAAGGYAVAPGMGGVDAWGYAPETLALMRRLKARWDPQGCLNAGMFLV